MRKLTAIVLGIVFSLGLGAFPCLAGTGRLDRLAAFLQPVSARVVTRVDAQILLDKGLAAHIRAGDIFAVVAGEKKIRDPRSGKVLDTLSQYGAFLVATRVKKRITYCRVLGAAAKVAPGSRVRRFANVPIYFVDSSGTGFQFFARLRERLPQLQWKGYVVQRPAGLSAKRPVLLIQYTPRKVEVLSGQGDILFLQSRSSASPLPGAETPPGPRSAAGARVSGPSRPSAGGPKAAAAAPQAWRVRRIALPVAGEIEALRVFDFDGKEAPEIILGLDGKLLWGHLTKNELAVEGWYATRDWQRLFDISALDIDGDGRPEVVVTALRDNRPFARVFKFSQGKLHPLLDADMLLATLTPAAGPPILIGEMASDILNARPRLYRVRLVAGRLKKTPLALQGLSQPYGVLQLREPGGELTVSLSPSDRLRVSDTRGKTLWESGETYGGSLRGIKIPQPGSRGTEDYRTLFLHAGLRKSSRGTILVARHDGPGIFANNPEYKNGRILALAWNGFSLDQVAKSPNLGGMIVDFDQYEQRRTGNRAILAAVVYHRRGVFQKARSGLVLLLPPF